MWRLQEILAEVTGLHAVSLQPAAGSQGELTGLMLIRAYFAERGEAEQRRKVVIPDTAHGTNPASRDDGRLRADAGEDRRARQHRRRRPARRRSTSTPPALMLTNPSTLGLFDENIEEIARSSTAPARSCTTTART